MYFIIAIVVVGLVQYVRFCVNRKDEWPYNET